MDEEASGRGYDAAMSVPPVTGERRPVTALFADMAGSTALADAMDAEDWSDLIGEGIRRMSEVVVRYEGRVDQVLGDGIVAFFGLHPAHEDDPQRAVRAGLEMIEEMRGYSDEVERQHRVRVPIRVGVNTGLVIVREAVDPEGRRNLTALGDPVNIAARLQAHASPDTLLVTAETYAHVTPNVEARHVGPLELKGKAEPVDTWEVTRYTGGLARRRGIAGLASPMVGRTAELEHLAAVLEQSRGGAGAAAVVTGEPGIGKSRLTAELLALATQLPGGAAWYEGRCVSYGETLPYHLAASLARSLLGLPQVDIGDGVRSTESEDVPAPVAADPYLAHLLSFQLPAATAAEISRLDPAGLLVRYVGALRTLIADASALRPAVLACEDTHWADPASVELLGRLIPDLQKMPVLLLIVTRADPDAPGWRLVSAARELYGARLAEVHLSPLSEDDGRALVSNLLEIESLQTETRDYILASSDGNPLFIEEVIRMLIERGAIEQRGERWVATRPVAKTEIPDTLHGLLLARIDRLPPDARNLLRIAAVIGRRFPVPVLADVMARRSSTEIPGDRLAELERTGLVELVASEPELECVFRHVLIQEAAYASLLRQERSDVHAIVAACFEERYRERLDEIAPVLAMHLERAGEIDRAVSYLERAGTYAITRFANHEAHESFRHARRLLGDEPADPAIRRHRARLDLLSHRAGLTFTPADESLATLGSVRAEALALDDEDLLAESIMDTAVVRTMRGEGWSSPDLRALLDEGLAIAAGRDDAVLRAELLAMSGSAHLRGSQYRAAVAVWEEAVPLLEAHGRLTAASLQGGDLAVALAQLGEFERALEWVERARRVGEASGNPDAVIDADLARAVIEGLLGHPEQAIEFAGTAARLADAVDNKACGIVARSVIGEHHILLGQHLEAIPVLEEGASLSEYCKLLPTRSEFTRALLDSARAHAAGTAPSLERIDRVLEMRRALGDRSGEGEVLRQRARDRLAAGFPFEEVHADYLAAEQIFRDVEARPALTQTVDEHARVLADAGRRDEAATIRAG